MSAKTEVSVADETSRGEKLDNAFAMEPTRSIADGETAHALTKAQARRILLKTDLVVMPLIVLTMTLAFLDKNGLGYAAVYGLKENAHLEDQQYSWLGSIFYFGYLAMEVPNLWLITKVPLGRFVGVCFILWGLDVTLMAASHNFAGLAVIRFFLGIFEAAMLPCMLIINATWYRREEQPLRTALWYNTFAGVFGGILSYAIGHIEGPLPTWKYIFLIYGTVTMAAGILLFFALPDNPSKAWFFNSEEKSLAVIRLAENQTGVEAHKKFVKSHILECVKDAKCWCIFACSFGYAIANAGITNFNPLIIAGYGFDQSKTVLMATPQAAVAMVSQAILTTISFWIPNMRCIFWVGSALIGLAGATMVHVLDVNTSRDASLAGVYLMGFYNVPWVFMLSLQSSNTAGTTKKTFMGVSIAIIYAVGNIAGPQLFLDSQAPYYSLGIGALMFAFALMAVTGFTYYLLCVAENKRRDSKYGIQSDRVFVGLELERNNKTDCENTNFRYTY